MKKYFVIVTFMLMSASLLCAQAVRVTTNECVELLNTVWILANGTTDTWSQQSVTEKFGRLADHRAVSMLKKENHDAIIYVKNFEHIGLPYAALQMKIGKGGTITIDAEKLKTDKMMLGWQPDRMGEFLSALGDFYRTSEFDKFYKSEVKVNNNLSMYSHDVDLTKVNALLGLDIKSVQYIVTFRLMQPADRYGVPFVHVDGRLLPMFFDSDSEAQCPSVFVCSALGMKPLRYVEGLFTAVIAEELRNDSHLFIPEYYYALFNLFSENEDLELRGFQVFNFMTKYAPLLLLDEYYKESPDKQQQCIARVEEYGFFWHRAVVEYMQHYYNDRARYPRFTDFVPQLESYIAYLPEISDRMKAAYDVSRNVYAESVYPSPYTDLDLSGENIDYEVKFSQPIKSSSVHITLKSLYRQTEPTKISHSMADALTLRFSVPTALIRKIGFYGLTIKAGTQTGASVKPVEVTYYQPNEKK